VAAAVEDCGGTGAVVGSHGNSSRGAVVGSSGGGRWWAAAVANINSEVFRMRVSCK
jgi:hypothetical protein